MILPFTLIAGVPYDVLSSTPGKRQRQRRHTRARRSPIISRRPRRSRPRRSSCACAVVLLALPWRINPNRPSTRLAAVLHRRSTLSSNLSHGTATLRRRDSWWSTKIQEDRRAEGIDRTMGWADVGVGSRRWRRRRRNRSTAACRGRCDKLGLDAGGLGRGCKTAPYAESQRVDHRGPVRRIERRPRARAARDTRDAVKQDRIHRNAAEDSPGRQNTVVSGDMRVRQDRIEISGQAAEHHRRPPTHPGAPRRRVAAHADGRGGHPPRERQQQRRALDEPGPRQLLHEEGHLARPRLHQTGVRRTCPDWRCSAARSRSRGSRWPIE